MNNPIHEQIENYLDYCTSLNQSEMTIKSKRHTFKHFIKISGATDLRKLDNEIFNLWLAHESKKGLSSRTINTRIAHLVTMIKYHQDMGMEISIKIPLIKKLKDKNPARRVYYTREEIDFVLEYADDFEWLLIKISFDTGMRISELRNMRLKSITDKKILFKGKGAKLRESYISNETRKRLDAWIIEKYIVDYVWARKNSQAYSTDDLRNRMRKCFYRAAKALETGEARTPAGIDDPEKLANKLRRFYPHSLRHSFGSNLQTLGAGLMEIQAMMGHNDAATTQRYLHGFDGHLEELFVKYEKPVQTTKYDNVGFDEYKQTIEARMDLFIDGLMAMKETLEEMQNVR